MSQLWYNYFFSVDSVHQLFSGFCVSNALVAFKHRLFELNLHAMGMQLDEHIFGNLQLPDPGRSGGVRSHQESPQVQGNLEMYFCRCRMACPFGLHFQTIQTLPTQVAFIYMVLQSLWNILC